MGGRGFHDNCCHLSSKSANTDYIIAQCDDAVLLRTDELLSHRAPPQSFQDRPSTTVLFPNMPLFYGIIAQELHLFPGSVLRLTVPRAGYSRHPRAHCLFFTRTLFLHNGLKTNLTKAGFRAHLAVLRSLTEALRKVFWCSGIALPQQTFQYNCQVSLNSHVLLLLSDISTMSLLPGCSFLVWKS